MTSSKYHWLAGIAAVMGAACLTAAPATALTVAPAGRSCDAESCYVTKVASTKAARTKRVQRQARVRRVDRRYVLRRERTRVVAWHGWAGSFHLDGRSYAGGNPNGPAGWQNNWEGGFHPTVFWRLRDVGGIN